MEKDLIGNDQAKFRANRTFICSVVFLDIVEYSKKPVVEQISMKEKFNGILTECLKDIPVNDRIILDTGDGAAIGFLSDPEDALFVAMSIRDMLHGDEQGQSGLSVRMGINLGPVKILKDINKQMNLIGDGINVAQRIMSFAEPGQLLVSRSYYDIVSCLSEEYARLFHYKGAKADKHIREHDIYSVENASLSPVGSLHHTHQLEKTETNVQLQMPAEPVKNKEVSAQKATDEPSTVRKNAIAGRNKLIIGICCISFCLIVVIGFFMLRSQHKIPASTTHAELTVKEEKEKRSEKKEKAVKREEKKVAEEGGHIRELFKSVSVKADGLEFILGDIKRSGEEIIITVRIHNTTKTDKSVAIYDDYVRWPKSTLLEQSGKSHEVNKVVFTKGGKTLTSQATGTQGLPIAAGQTATVSLTFKNAGKGSRKFTLHPFVYTGRSWTEHNLLMKSDI